MSTVIATARSEADLIASRIRELVPNASFGVASFSDYPLFPSLLLFSFLFSSSPSSSILHSLFRFYSYSPFPRFAASIGLFSFIQEGPSWSFLSLSVSLSLTFNFFLTFFFFPLSLFSLLSIALFCCFRWPLLPPTIIAMHMPSLSQLVYNTTFPRPRTSDPASFAAHITRNLVPEVRIETSTFYGSLDCIEAQYPGLDYSYGPHRMRLGRFPWHRRLFRVFDELRLTEAEISSLCRWEGTKSARERYEKEEGVKVQDTTANGVRPASPFASSSKSDGRESHTMGAGHRTD